MPGPAPDATEAASYLRVSPLDWVGLRVSPLEAVGRRVSPLLAGGASPCSPCNSSSAGSEPRGSLAMIIPSSHGTVNIRTEAGLTIA
jgi:hypothetical protein